MSNRTSPKADNSGVVGLSRFDKKPEVVPVLRAAIAILRKEGWFPHYLPEHERFAAIKRGDRRCEGTAMINAIQRAGNASVWCHHARKTLQRITGQISLGDWEAHPLRLKSEVFALLNRAIEIEGGTPNRPGSWSVSSGPWNVGGDL